MGEATNKAIMIGVGLFVTLMIVSGIMFIFSQMKEVYKQVGTTDTTIGNRFGEYASYNNTQVTGLAKTESVPAASKIKSISDFALERMRCINLGTTITVFSRYRTPWRFLMHWHTKGTKE